MAAVTIVMRWCAIAGVVVLVASCSNEPAGPVSPVAPTISAISVAGNSDNALSAIVSVRVRDADSVAVRFYLDDVPPKGDSVTPAVRVLVDSATIPVLGLLPGRDYTLRAI